MAFSSSSICFLDWNTWRRLQPGLDDILVMFQWKFMLGYLEDNVHIQKDLGAHLKHVKSVSTLVRDAISTMKLDKDILFSSTMNKIGLVVHYKQHQYPITQFMWFVTLIPVWILRLMSVPVLVQSHLRFCA